ncbi:FmdB family zinc ribbon protein [Methylorubrum extorquens]|uniref:FmdB family zinc ribbon protein n=1 Tax=Methylorubrum extorquens TaxID=408 RepID=UPI001EE5D6E7|nr:zinc ribbon domain-containing protein [Methylorubrum extorquens]MCG5249490.1 zinc ribbon domain-containing protein [Methylorubrum extorquens]
MPIYDYDCAACGPFTALRPMAAFRDPCACPACGVRAGRTFLRAPAITGMDPSRRSALAANERLASSQRAAQAPHPAGCGCCVRRWPIPSGLSSNGGRVFSASGPLRRSRP